MIIIIIIFISTIAATSKLILIMMMMMMTLPMDVTLVGIVTDVRDLQNQKAYIPYDSSYDDI